MVLRPIKNYISDLISKQGRGLSTPDGRPLHAYRLTTEEFESLGVQLSRSLVEVSGAINWVDGADRGLVLYASEWWRRNYDGGHWRWEDMFSSLGWPDLTPTHRQELVAKGIRYWKRMIHQNSAGSNAYLMSLVTEGGFPVKLVEREGGHLRKYLKAVLSDYSIYCSAGMSAERIAESQSGRLPPAFRRPAVYQLTAELIISLYDLSEHTQDSSNPFEALNQLDKSWQDKLPISLESDAAKLLVNSLLKTAARRRNIKYEKLTLTRYFSKDGEGALRHKAKITLPSSISLALLVEELGIPDEKIPRRLEMAVYVDGKINKVASLSKEGEEYFVYAYSPESLLLDISPTVSVSALLMEYGGARLSSQELTIVGGSGLEEELPLVCYEESDQYIVIGQGGLQSRLDHLFVSLPDGLNLREGSEGAETLDLVTADFHKPGQWLKINQPIVVDLQENFSCTITPGHTADSSTLFIARGKREYLFESGGKLLVFIGVPNFYKSTDNRLKLVQAQDIYWSLPNSRDWLSCSSAPPKGTVRIRIVETGQCVFSMRLTILPSAFSLQLESGTDSRSGAIVIEGLSGAAFATHSEIPVELTAVDDEESTTISCVASQSFSGKIPLLVRWPNGASCQLLVPFPGQGTQFVDVNGTDLGQRVVALNDLVSVSAVGISPDEHQIFILQGELGANDIGKHVSKSIFGFSKKIGQISTGYSEFPLVDLYTKIRELFSYSADLDARVSLYILQGSTIKSKLDITQFDSELAFDESTSQVCHISTDGKPRDDRVAVNFIAMGGEETLEAEAPVLTLDGGFAWQLQHKFSGPPYLAVAAGSAIRSIRPCVIFSKDFIGEGDQEAPQKLESIFISPDRRRALKQLMVELAEDPFDPRWPELLANVRKFAEVHPDSLDLYKAIIDNGTVAAGILVRSTGQDLPSLMEWEDYLPFRWWQIPIKDYLRAYKGYANFVVSEHAEYQDIMLEAATNQLLELHGLAPLTDIIINAVLNEALDRKPAGFLAKAELITGPKIFDVLNSDLRNELMVQAGDEEWPSGISRDEWEKQFDTELPWLDHGVGYRKPMLDAIVAAAYSVVSGIYLAREERAFICVMRAFNPQQFDRMLKFAESAFYLSLRDSS
jgi:hypothetical protein